MTGTPYRTKDLTKEDKEEIRNNEIWNAVEVIHELCTEYNEIKKAIEDLESINANIPIILFNRLEAIDEQIFNYVKEGV